MGHRFLLTAIAPAMLFGAGAQRPEQTQPVRQSNLAETPHFELVSTIAFSNTFGATRDEQFNNAEIFLLDPDGTNPRQLTDNQAADAFPTLSPNGKKIVFDSNRLRGTGPLNTSDLFVMNTDGTEQTHLIRAASPTWSPDSKRIAFHASASGTGLPILTTPGAATSDSDLFIADVDDLLNGVEAPRNVTNTPEFIDDDPDWSPDGHTLVFTRHDVDGNHMNAVTAEIYTLDVDGSGEPQRLTFNDFEERAPDISPDGTRIVFMCRIGDPANPPPAPQLPTFELCVINADGTGEIATAHHQPGGRRDPQLVARRPTDRVPPRRWRRPQPAVRDQPRRHRRDADHLRRAQQPARLLGPAQGQSRQIAGARALSRCPRRRRLHDGVFDPRPRRRRRQPGLSARTRPVRPRPQQAPRRTSHVSMTTAMASQGVVRVTPGYLRHALRRGRGPFVARGVAGRRAIVGAPRSPPECRRPHRDDGRTSVAGRRARYSRVTPTCLNPRSSTFGS